MSELEKKIENVAPAPIASKGSVTEDFHGTPIADPYRHLEDLDAPATLKWAHDQQDRFAQFISGYERRKSIPLCCLSIVRIHKLNVHFRPRLCENTKDNY